MIENNITELLHIYDQTIYVDTHFDPKDSISSDVVQKKILVAVTQNDLTDENRLLLSKMMAACNLTENEYNVISVLPENLLSNINYYQPETILLFNLTINNEIFHSLKEKNTPFRFAGKKFLLCDSLTALSNSPSLKSTLWTYGLKPIFNI